jgi:hypothetical protein
VADDQARSSIPTEPPPTDVTSQLRARTARRTFVALLLLFLGLGALGLFGVKSRTVTAAAGGYQLSLRYAAVARPGLDVPWSLAVRRPGGFPGGLTVVVTSHYLDALDQNGVTPAPAQETTDGERTIWRFDAPPGDTLTVSLDAQVESGVQLTRIKGRVEVLPGPNDPPAAALAFSTFVMP